MNNTYPTVRELNHYKKCAKDYNIKDFSSSIVDVSDFKKHLLLSNNVKSKNNQKSKKK
jgi:hypothetical protein